MQDKAQDPMQDKDTGSHARQRHRIPCKTKASNHLSVVSKSLYIKLCNVIKLFKKWQILAWYMIFTEWMLSNVSYYQTWWDHIPPLMRRRLLLCIVRLGLGLGIIFPSSSSSPSLHCSVRVRVRDHIPPLVVVSFSALFGILRNVTNVFLISFIIFYRLCYKNYLKKYK